VLVSLAFVDSMEGLSSSKPINVDNLPERLGAALNMPLLSLLESAVLCGVGKALLLCPPSNA
jgi:hypothetical protein